MEEGSQVRTREHCEFPGGLKFPCATCRGPKVGVGRESQTAGRQDHWELRM